VIETKCRGTPARHRQALGFQSYLPATAPAGIERHPLLQHHIIGNAEDRLFSDNSFDLIMADRVVEHIEPQTASWLRCTAFCVPDGRVPTLITPMFLLV